MKFFATRKREVFKKHERMRTDVAEGVTGKKDCGA